MLSWRCHSGHSLSGTSVNTRTNRQCVDDGDRLGWTGDPPVCEGKCVSSVVFIERHGQCFFLKTFQIILFCLRKIGPYLIIYLNKKISEPFPGFPCCKTHGWAQEKGKKKKKRRETKQKTEKVYDQNGLPFCSQTGKWSERTVVSEEVWSGEKQVLLPSEEPNVEPNDWLIDWLIDIFTQDCREASTCLSEPRSCVCFCACFSVCERERGV